MEKSSTNTKCPNCDKEYNSEYEFCPWCGQENKNISLSFRHILKEFLSANFNLDSKFLTTFKLLLFSPAFLTNEYLKGRHKKYLSPIRIYLIISLVYFFTISFMPTNVEFNLDNDNEDDIAQVKNIPVVSTDSAVMNKDRSESKDEWDEYLTSRIKLLKTKEGKTAFINMIRNNASKGMFLLMPVTALLFMFLFRNRYYYEHLIFTIHLLSVFFAVFTIFFLINVLLRYSNYGLIVEVPLLLWLSYLWVKRFYHKSTWGTIWRLSVFHLMMIVILILFLIAVIIVSLLLY